jgi:hypothetical protein
MLTFGHIGYKKSFYYISAIVYIANGIFSNLIHVTTKTTRNTMATVLEQALTMYDVGSFSVKRKDRNNYYPNLIWLVNKKNIYSLYFIDI